MPRDLSPENIPTSGLAAFAKTALNAEIEVEPDAAEMTALILGKGNGNAPVSVVTANSPVMPLLDTLALWFPASAKVIVSAADLYIPVVVDPAKLYVGAAAVPFAANICAVSGLTLNTCAPREYTDSGDMVLAASVESFSPT